MSSLFIQMILQQYPMERLHTNQMSINSERLINDLLSFLIAIHNQTIKKTVSLGVNAT